MLRAVELLVKAVAAKYRLSKKSQDNLAEAIDGVLKEIGAALFSNFTEGSSSSKDSS